MTITAEMIKELRELTGVGIGKCKEALEQTGGNMELAIENLRKAGIAGAVKKEGRIANEGMITTAENNDRVVVIEVNAETDFVVKNDRFQQFLKDVAAEAILVNPASLEDFLKHPFSKGQGMTLDEYRATIVQAIGENIQIRRMKIFPKGANSSLGVYSHLGGKIVTIVEIEGSNKAKELADEIAMHVAAAHPEYVNPEDVPSETCEKEKEIARSQIQGKPAFVADKIVEGKLSKFFDEQCLNRQLFIKDDSMKVGELVEKKGKEMGCPLAIKSFIRWSVGQG